MHPALKTIKMDEYLNYINTNNCTNIKPLNTENINKSNGEVCSSSSSNCECKQRGNTVGYVTSKPILETMPMKETKIGARKNANTSTFTTQPHRNKKNVMSTPQRNANAAL